MGSNLDSQLHFSHKYNSKNFLESRNLEFNEVYFSAARAEKWRINQNPSQDKEHIDELKNILGNLRAKKLILISTVDVFIAPYEVTESSRLIKKGLHPYGLHRAELEEFVQDNFEQHYILRLPGLFGPGLKKNVIYDLMHDNNVSEINPDGSLQYYGVENLGKDIRVAINNGLQLVHLTSEPISSSKIAEIVFNQSLSSVKPGLSAPRYDVQSKYASVFGGMNHYIYSAKNQIREIKKFVDTERNST